MNKSIVVQCDEGPLTHAQLTAHSAYIDVEYGKRVVVPVPRFLAVTKLTLWFSEFPELKALHDGVGWNVEALHKFIQSPKPESPPPGRVFCRKRVS